VGSTAPAPPAPEQPAAPKKKKPFYKNPVTWVLAGVGVYVIYVLASSSDSSNNNQPVPGRLLLPELEHGAGSPGPTLFRF
jgi:hypothetical protein